MEAAQWLGGRFTIFLIIGPLEKASHPTKLCVCVHLCAYELYMGSIKTLNSCFLENLAAAAAALLPVCGFTYSNLNTCPSGITLWRPGLVYGYKADCTAAFNRKQKKFFELTHTEQLSVYESMRPEATHQYSFLKLLLINILATVKFLNP